MTLRHAELKAERALEHFENLKRELQAYYDSEPCVISRYEKSEIGRRVLRVELKDPSDRAYLLAGDFAHNLRCTLDHVVYSLVVKATGKAPDDKAIQWPVLTAIDEKTFKKQTKGVPDAAVAIIGSLQPYHEGPGDAFKQHPLWQLHKLDIIDKHRRVAINEHALNSYFPMLSRSSDFTLETSGNCFEVSFPIDSPPVEMHYDPKPDVRFGDAEEGVSLNVSRLEAICKFVTGDVLPRFAQFFGQSAAA